MKIVVLWISTVAASFCIELTNELRMFKDVADAGYKINIDRLSDLSKKLNPDASKITLLSMLIPIFNIIQVFERITKYNNIRPMLLDQLSIIDALEEIKVMVILFTENYNKSVQVDREITVCCDLEKKPVIPLKLSEEPLTGIKKFYLSNINWIDFKGEKEQYDILLKSIIINIGKEAEPNDETKLILDESTYKVHCGKEITPQMIFEAVEIDKLVYNDSYIGNYDNCVKWWKKNKYIYVMLEDIKTKKIIGYINAMPINNTLYEIIKKGEIIDVTINDENIETYDLPDSKLPKLAY